jgi:hypothetical protein
MPDHPPTAGPVRGGINMLMPLSYDVEWTQLDEVFNDYPYQSGQAPPNAAGSGYQNPNRSATIPIGPNTLPNIALVGSNPKRVSIILQNNSTATGTDIAPTMYFNFGAQAQVGIGIGLAPGVGLVLDINVQADSLYVTFGPETNTGNSVVIQGAVLETSRIN